MVQAAPRTQQLWELHSAKEGKGVVDGVTPATSVHVVGQQKGGGQNGKGIT